MAPGGLLHLRQWCSDWVNPSWWGSKLVVSDTASLFLLNSLSSGGAVGLLPFSGLGTVHWTSGSLSRSGNGLVAVGTAPNGSTTMSLAAYMPVSLVAGQPVPDWTSICFLPDPTVTASKAGFSPDGTAVVWADSRGVIEAPRPIGRDSNSFCTFPAGWPALLAAGGTLPFWSKAGAPVAVATRLTGWPAKPVVARTGSGAIKSTTLTLTATPARARTGTIQVKPCATCAWKRYRSLKWPATATGKVKAVVTARKGSKAVYRLVLPATATGKALTTRALTVVGR
jgi:hypothetical protein